MKLRVITKNHAADSEKGFLTKFIQSHMSRNGLPDSVGVKKAMLNVKVKLLI